MSLNSFGNKLRTGPIGAIFFGIVVICVGVLAFTGLGQYVNDRQKDASAPKAATDVVATINKTPITVAEFENVLSALKEQSSAQGNPSSLLQEAQLRAQAFNEMETPILEAELAKQHGLTVTDAEVAAVRNKDLSQLKTELSLPSSASESDVSNALAATGHTLDDFIHENEIKTGLLGQKYQEYLTQTNQASEDTVLKYYTQVHVRHILISNKKHPDAQALALAESLIARLQKGADFAQLAKQYSEDPGTASKGGDDGFIDSTTQYVPEFKNAALALKPGQMTQTPVDSPQYGYFIIQALATKSNLPKDYKKNHQQYTSQVTNSLAEQQGESELAAAKAKAAVNISDSRLKADVALAGGQVDPSQFPSILADYDKALKNGDADDKAAIYATEAEIYQELAQPDKEEAALQNALSASEDPMLRVMLGDVYKQKGDTQNALAQYQLADQNSYDDPAIHFQLLQDYKALKQTKLADAETAWIKQYTARQRQANAAPSPTP